MHLKLNYKVRSALLSEPVLVFEEKEIKKKDTETLESLVKYYEDLLETLAGKEIWHILELMAQAESIIANRRSPKKAKK